MEQYENIVKIVALTMGVSWASGINLYAAILVLGVGGLTGHVSLPADLQIVSNPFVIGAAGLMYLVEFVADKIPGVDTGWDAIHTFIRIPAGALLAFGAVGDVNQPLAIAAAVMGGGLATATHATKSGSRVMINASPEPFTNWAASVGEDAVVVAGLWAAMNHPIIFIILLILFILLLIWLLPKIWRGIKKIIGFILHLFGSGKEEKKVEAQTAKKTESITEAKHYDDGVEKKLEKLNHLLEKKLITREEYQKKKQELLESL